MVSTDSGTDIEVFKKYAFIQQQVAYKHISDVYPDSNINDLPVESENLITKCQAALDEKIHK